MFGSNKDKHKNKANTADTTQNNQPTQPVQPTQVSQSTPVSQPSPVSKKSMDTLISASCKIEGNIQSEQSVKIEGQVEGNINVKETVVIATNGQVTGDVIAHSLIVYGHLKGDSQLKEIHIQDGGHIDGNVKTQSLKVDPNATYNGVVTMTKESLQPASSLMNKSTDSADKKESANKNTAK